MVARQPPPYGAWVHWGGHAPPSARDGAYGVGCFALHATLIPGTRTSVLRGTMRAGPTE